MTAKMRVAFFNTHHFDRQYFDEIKNKYHLQIDYFETKLGNRTWKLIDGHKVVCLFVNDCVNKEVLEQLHKRGVELIALRSAGLNHVDLQAAKELGLKVVRVPAYSPHAIAEYALGLMFTLNRKYHKSYPRVREGNFSLEGLMGFDFFGKIAGIVGTGKIGEAMVRPLLGLGMKVLAFDPNPSPECARLGVDYVALEELFSRSDVISLHCPLTPQTHHMVNAHMLKLMKKESMLINTGRGGLIDTLALIDSLKVGKPAFVGLDVYEEEEAIFFEDYSTQVIQDDIFARLLTFPNVLITGHQAFFTSHAMEEIAKVTCENIHAFASGERLVNEVFVQ